MKTVDEILKKAGDEFVDKLRKQFETRGHKGGTLNDTHKAEQSLSSKVEKETLKIEGLLRTVVLMTGRKPGGISKEGQEKIGEWITRKLGIEKDSTEWKQAKFLIIRKIINEGTEIFTKKAKGLEIELIIIELNKELEKEVGNQIALNITDTVIKAYEEGRS